MTKSGTNTNNKYLLVVSFLDGRNFPRRPKTKLIVEAKFDGEQLSTDPIDHFECPEINQELAWELDKKTLQMHKLQRSCIKAVCYAVSDTVKESIGYIVLDIRSAPDGLGAPKWYPLLQPKYAKSKPTIQINIYIEEDQNDTNANEQFADNKQQIKSIEHDVSSSRNSSIERYNEYDEKNLNERLKISLIEDEGYFLLGKPSPSSSQTFVLTITLAYAKNLVRLITNNDVRNASSNFYFIYSLLNNQVRTKEFGDIISSQINGERSAVRLHTDMSNLKRFFDEQSDLEIVFCSNDNVLAKCYLNWKIVSDKLYELKANQIFIEEMLKLEPLSSTSQAARSCSPLDATTSALLAVQISICRENAAGDNVSLLSAIDNRLSKENLSVHSIEQTRKSPVHHHLFDKQSTQHQQNSQIIYQNDSTLITVDEKPKESIINMKSAVNSLKTAGAGTRSLNNLNELNVITEEMQLKAAYELQLWKEEREKEFEANLKKLEVKKLQALADAFKQHDVERELIVQKKIKEYNDLEMLLKNSLHEVEKREKQLAINESQIARIRADLHHEYEQKLVELREASKRVQEKADHQVQLQKVKIESLEEDMNRYKRQVIEWEKRYADKEAEFVRYKEKENSRPEVRLQSEISVLNVEKLELERKLDNLTKSKNHYKEQWTKALHEIAMMKKKEEANAKATLKKQQQELDHLRLRYLAAEENDLLKSDEKQLQSLKSELEKLKLNSQRAASNEPQRFNDQHLNGFTSNLENIDPVLSEHAKRLIEERDTLLRTGVYSHSDGIIVELDKRIKDCYRK